jgi:heptaprenyl diphosphate synthase
VASKAKKVAIAGVLIALALALSLAERLFPIGILIPVPGVKLGLANIVTLFALFYMGPSVAFVVLVLRCLLASVFSGISSLAFSLAGGILAYAAMLALKSGYGRHFSLFGVSMGGAVLHNIGQILIAAAILGNAIIFSYLPFLLITGLVTGFGTAAVCLPVMNAIDSNEGLKKSFPYAFKYR